MVNHPSHYTKNGKKECIVEMEEKYGKIAVLMFCILNAYKYCYRAGNKEGNTKAQDYKKALWYNNYAISIYERMGFIAKLFTKKFLNK